MKKLKFTEDVVIDTPGKHVWEAVIAMAEKYGIKVHYSIKERYDVFYPYVYYDARAKDIACCMELKSGKRISLSEFLEAITQDTEINIVQLSEQYRAEIKPDGIQVGCTFIQKEKVLEVAKYYSH